MKFKHSFFAVAALCAVVGLQAQNATDSGTSGSTAPSGTNGSNGMNGTNAMSGPNSATTDTSGTTSSTTTTTTTTPYVPPAPAPASMPMAYQTQTMPPTRLEADVSAIYAFRMNTTGVSADIGGTMNNNFLGFEYTYLNPRGNSYDPVAGRIKENENIDSYEAAYRYSAPLSWFSQPGQWSPVSFYIGGSAGVSYVQLKTIVPRYNFRTSDDDEGVFTAEGNAGVEWAVNRNWGVKVGYRYIYLDRVALYGQRGNIDTGALEYGVSFKW